MRACTDEKSILITGAGGVVGTALARHLREGGKFSQVHALASRADCDFESFPQTLAILRDLKPRVVVHLAAAVFGVGGNLKFPADTYRRNILINTNVVEACRLVGVQKIVAMGSVAMYGDKVGGHYVEADVFEGRAHASEEAYGFAKRAMLVQLQAYQAQYGLMFGFAIATNMYGPNDRFDLEYGHVVPSLIKKFDDAARTKEPVIIWGDGTPTRDFLYSADAARGLESLVDRGLGAFNLATGRSNSISELVGVLQQEFPSVEVQWDRTKPKGQLTRSYDVSRLASIGFSPNYSLAEGIRETVKWYKDHRHTTRSYLAAQ